MKQRSNEIIQFNSKLYILIKNNNDDLKCNKCCFISKCIFNDYDSLFNNICNCSILHLTTSDEFYFIKYDKNTKK